MPLPAKLPSVLIEPPPRPLRQAPDGEIVHVVFTALEVDENLDCYLDPDTPLREGRGVNKIQVRRDADGYHVGIHESDMTFRPRRLHSRNGLVPVISVTVGRL